MSLRKVLQILKVITLSSLMVFAASSVFAGPVKVMTFNVMCDFCGTGAENRRFQEKLVGVVDTIRRHNPDLVSIQEIWSGFDIRKIDKLLGDEYIAIYASNFMFGYADPTLFVRKSRFKIFEHDGMWLGPRAPGFSFGWKTGFPRRVEWVELEDLTDGLHFIFAGTHFDNRSVNKDPSAELLIAHFREFKFPFIFAGDTNLKPDYPAYQKIKSVLRDTFFEVSTHPYFSNTAVTNADGCNLTKAPSFPECRVDHVLLSSNAPWKVKAWGVDTFRYFGKAAFLSDHRAIVVELESIPAPAPSERQK